MRHLWILLTLLLGACSAVDALNGLSPEAGLETVRDIPYRPGPRRGLDVYRPTNARNAPVAVFFYGGAWQDGSKADYAFVARALAQSGIVVVVPDYRVYPEVKFEGFMRDGAAAVAWARQNVSRFGGDPNRIVLVGHSAGAHIASLLTLDRRWLAAEGLDVRSTLAGFVGLAGPYDFLPLTDPNYKIILGPPARPADTQPITFADGRNPPLFLATGADDTTVKPRNTEALAAKTRENGGPVETKIYPGLSHRTLIGVLSGPLGFVAPVRQDVTNFILAVPPVRPRAGG